jgi:hypothetical protein
MRQETFENHEETLKEIEIAVITLYRRQPELSDWNVDLVYQALQRLYKAEVDQRPAAAAKLSEIERELYDSLKSVCDSWMADRPAVKKSAWKKPALPDPPKTHQDILSCLKALRSSLKLWNKNFGRVGYLEYINQFIPRDIA